MPRDEYQGDFNNKYIFRKENGCILRKSTSAVKRVTTTKDTSDQVQDKYEQTKNENFSHENLNESENNKNNNKIKNNNNKLEEKKDNDKNNINKNIGSEKDITTREATAGGYNNENDHENNDNNYKYANKSAARSTTSDEEIDA